MKRLKSNLSNPLIIAIDDLDKETAKKYIDELIKAGVFNNGVWGVKLIGSELNNKEFIMELQNTKGVLDKPIVRVFSDPLSLCMPDKVESLLSSYTPAHFISFPAMGGLPLLREAAKFQKICPTSRVVPLTVPTYFDEPTCNSVLGKSVEGAVIYFALIIAHLGFNYLICPPRELKILNKYPEFEKIHKIVPAIRPRWFRKKGIHQETMTPKEAVEARADYLVVGDPIIYPIVHFQGFAKKRDLKKNPDEALKEAWKMAVLKSIEAIEKILDEISDYLVDTEQKFIVELNKKSSPLEVV